MSRSSSELERGTPAAYTPAHLAKKILASRHAISGERKQVTVLFCDIIDSTSLAERLGVVPTHVLSGRWDGRPLALGRPSTFGLGPSVVLPGSASQAHDSPRFARWCCSGILGMIRRRRLPALIARNLATGVWTTTRIRVPFSLRGIETDVFLSQMSSGKRAEDTWPIDIRL